MRNTFLVVVAVCLLSGCGGEPVREDRAADWNRSGDAVAFQHPEQGVYVARKDGDGLAQIFAPDAKVLATSRPLFCPTDGRLIFTAAYDPEGKPRPVQGGGPGLPEGNIVTQRPVKYTCWLRGADEGPEPQAPKPLFHAACEHIGYVSAGLAVRWRPDGKAVLFVDSGPQNDRQHGVYEFHLETGAVRPVFPHRADAVIFDFTPRGSHLVCVAGFHGTAHPDPAHPTTGNGNSAAIWIGHPGEDKSWWKLPGQHGLAAGELPSLLESLRAGRPAWTSDESRFASVRFEPAATPEQPGTSSLQITTVAQRETKAVYEVKGTLTDLHWSPAADRLGFLERTADEQTALRFHQADGTAGDLLRDRTIRRFAGFDATGTQIAYVVADETGLPSRDDDWSFILPPDRLARDILVVADIHDLTSHRDVFSGMRVTFPAWSPTEQRVSLWLTFTPRFRSLFSLFLRWGLWPGDPAATLDLQTGGISWMAVTPQEELQIGHHFLLQREYAQAWHWYEKANSRLPARTPPTDLAEFVRSLGAPERSQLFEYHCLMKLGQHEKAQALRDDFERNFFPVTPQAANAGEPGAVPASDPILQQFGPQAEFVKRLLHDLYVAEVFLSLDAPEAGLQYLQEQIARPAQTAVEQLSAELALSQVLLVAGRRDEYVRLCSQRIFPAVRLAWNPANGANPAAAAGTIGGGENLVLQMAGQLALLP
ncbi:MAG: hypothetical protein JSS02_00015, partial [Planctomycetes bacterium]|nr:hypothetical protein [Planctomycetota bacterium]